MAGKKVLINEKEIVRAALKTSGFSQGKAAESAGITRNALNCQLNRPDSTMTLTSVYSLLNAMGFEIVVRDKGAKYGGVEFVISEESEPIGLEQYLSETQKAEIAERVAAKELETEQEMEQLKRMIRK